MSEDDFEEELETASANARALGMMYYSFRLKKPKVRVWMYCRYLNDPGTAEIEKKAKHYLKKLGDNWKRGRLEIYTFRRNDPTAAFLREERRASFVAFAQIDKGRIFLEEKQPHVDHAIIHELGHVGLLPAQPHYRILQILLKDTLKAYDNPVAGSKPIENNRSVSAPSRHRQVLNMILGDCRYVIVEMANEHFITELGFEKEVASAYKDILARASVTIKPGSCGWFRSPMVITRGL